MKTMIDLALSDSRRRPADKVKILAASGIVPFNIDRGDFQ
jgi:hypothetical protein